MGFLTPQAAGKPGIHRLPTGAFSVDSQGNIVSSTVPQWVPEAHIHEIGHQVLLVFRGAAKAHLQFTELRIQYEAFKITAREMRGGAIIFLLPKTSQAINPS